MGRRDNCVGIRTQAKRSLSKNKSPPVPKIAINSNVVVDSTGSVMENVRNQILGRIPTFCVSFIEMVFISFDISNFNYFIEAIFEGPLLVIANCLFNFGVLIGAITVWVLADSFPLWISMFFLSLIKVGLHFLMTATLPLPLTLTILGAEGLLLGWTQSLLFYNSFSKIPNPAKRLLVALIFLGLSIGSFVSALFIDGDNREITVAKLRNDSTMTHFRSVYNSGGALEPMALKFRVDFQKILFGSGILQVLLGYLLYDVWKTPEPPTNSTVTRLQHDFLVEQASNDASSFLPRLMTLGWFFGFFSTALIAMVPYYLFCFSLSPNRLSLLYFCMFGFMLGRILFTIYGSRFSPIFWLIIGMVITGISTCTFPFEDFRMASALLHGLGISLISPAYAFFLLRIHGTSIHALITGSIAAQLLYPIVNTQILSNYGPELYSASNFIVLLGLTVVLVALLNLMSNMASPADPVQQRVWRFFRGEGLKRTTSIRKFISSVRGSIRRSRYGKLRRGKSPQPLGQSTPLGPNPIAVNSYRSTQSASKDNRGRYGRRLNTSIEDETSSACVTPNTISQAITPEPISDSHQGHLDDELSP